MKGKRPPVAVMVLAIVYLAVGTIGFVVHFPNLRGIPAFQFEDVWIELTEVLAILCGVFMLLGWDWARWLAIAWIAFHVILSALDGFRGFAIHCFFLAAIAWFLTRPDAVRFFHAGRTPMPPI